ncbi:hypothetical protein X798_05770 [Onchocerca flexuosa]|uniref:Uncharacterized protein n=1 Tax=Onchocerca flexuosa TaxID=387005 RepID=A0A238BRF3_9BILA|nr:hypothetical protein X798_05770 [Onchocerca flexuosa]
MKYSKLSVFPTNGFRFMDGEASSMLFASCLGEVDTKVDFDYQDVNKFEDISALPDEIIDILQNWGLVLIKELEVIGTCEYQAEGQSCLHYYCGHLNHRTSLISPLSSIMEFDWN